MDLFVVHNMRAGEGEWPRARLDRLLRDAGHRPTIVAARSAWAETIEDVRADAFVAAGGDGTFQKLAIAMRGRDEPIALFATGTANNIIRSLDDVGTDDPAERVARWGEREHLLQIAMARIGRLHRPFVELAGAGAFARVLGDKPCAPVGTPGAVRLLAARRRLADEIMTGEPFRTAITIGDETTEGEFILIACLNLSSFGPRVVLAPAASPASPMLTVCGVPADGRAAFADWLAGSGTNPAAWRIGLASDVTLETAGPTHLDDRLWPDEPKRGRLHLEGGAASVRVWA